MKKLSISFRICACISMLILAGIRGCNKQEEHPNVLLILTDDQGYGDLRIHGNPHIQTPVIDAFAEKNIRFTDFYVCPVCAPTRSSLMTGRFSLRTGIRDTYNGGAIMSADEVTIAEMLKQAGYKTGIFGKWHLGDNYPSRPMDQGFDESVVHLSGGMGQVGDFTTWFRHDSSYFDPVLWHNGEQQAYSGYCTDIFANEAMRFISENKDNPFFCYLAFNAPHVPLQVPDVYYQKYKDIEPETGFEGIPMPEMSENDKEDARKVYAMVNNIDDDLGKLFQQLEELGIKENTIVIFMTDNGPQQRRYVAGMRGRKSYVYRGGVRVPFFLSFPAKYKIPQIIDHTAAQIDVLPTLAELCNASVPKDRIIDGKSLVPLLEDKNAVWPDRTLFFYWTRKYPEKYTNIALQKGNSKLVANGDFDSEFDDFELFDIKKDPYELNNLITEDPQTAVQLKKELDSMLYQLTLEDHLVHQPPIIIGSDKEPTCYLNRNDADGQRAIWSQKEIYGFWNVKILEGDYNIKFKFIEALEPGGKMYLEAGQMLNLVTNNSNSDIIEMKNVHFPDMECKFLPFYSAKGMKQFPFWVEIEKI